MALIHCSFTSNVISKSVGMHVILPEPTGTALGTIAPPLHGKFPTLYLLHGFGDDYTCWIRKTSIERYVSNRRLAVVMPDVHRSFYSDTASGYRYWKFLTEELPGVARALFPLSEVREDNFVAGFSMGGYGAFKWALSFPNHTAAAASISGVMDVSEWLGLQDETVRAEMRSVFGDFAGLQGSDRDLFALIEKLSKSSGTKPKLFQCCGTSDRLHKMNARFREHAARLNLALDYEESRADHEWGYVDAQIQKILQWLPLQKTA